MSDEVLSPDEQIIRDMGDEMNEIRVGRAKAYFQIRHLRAQLAEANQRIEALETKQRKFVERAAYLAEQERLEANKVIYTAARRIEALEAGLTKIAAGEVWRHITDVCVCQWCGQPGEEGGIEHFACCPSVIAKKALEAAK